MNIVVKRWLRLTGVGRPKMQENSIRVELKSRDEIKVLSENPLRLKVVGCEDLLQALRDYRKLYGDEVKLWPLPSGQQHQDILIRELILKLNGKWEYPYLQEELCHCRMVKTDFVDQAIIAGAHDLDIIRRQTSACTACGTCQPEIEKILKYRKNQV